MTGSFRTVIAPDGFELPVYVAEPARAPRGGVLVLQEIFGLTGHIRSVADRLAQAGYAAAAPDLFARTGGARPIGYGDPEAGLALVAQTTREGLDADIGAALAQLPRPLGVIGFCWGGGEAWRAAARTGLSAAACFYPTRMTGHLKLAPACPVLVQLAEGDTHTPPEIVAAMRAVKPDLDVRTYPAIHGFMCEDRPGYAAGPAGTAWAAALELFDAALG